MKSKKSFVQIDFIDRKRQLFRFDSQQAVSLIGALWSPKQEPDELAAYVRSCAGGGIAGSSYFYRNPTMNGEAYTYKGLSGRDADLLIA
ncbi:hypothetical protein D2B06_25650 [Salmonella enterica]|nr:hypothetical protein [Salmonella enterica]